MGLGREAVIFLQSENLEQVGGLEAVVGVEEIEYALTLVVGQPELILLPARVAEEGQRRITLPAPTRPVAIVFQFYRVDGLPEPARLGDGR